MKKNPTKSLLVDRLHKGFVVTCIGVTIYGLIGLGMRWYNYFTVIRPAREHKALMEKQALLQEGASSELI